MKKKYGALIAGALFCCGALLVACGKNQSEGEEVHDVTQIEDNQEEQQSEPDLAQVTEAIESEASDVAEKSQLTGYLNIVKNYDTSPYSNPEVVEEPIKIAEAVVADSNASQEEVDDALVGLKEGIKMLCDSNGFRAISLLANYDELPDPYVFQDGSVVESTEDWPARSEEISEMYEYYMYGPYRDGSDETLSYELEGTTLTITVERQGRTTSFPVTVEVPDASKVDMPEDGWPVIVSFHAIEPQQYALEHGYAFVTLNTYAIAADDSTRTGCFYDLYPYGDTWEEQTGVLMAWSWGASKVLDALEQGLGMELNINPENSIITGVSRWGKATAVCGAFETRFKMVVPSCSGAGGLAIYRYQSEGNTYDFSSKGASEAYTYGQNEPLSSLQASGEKGWFNNKFCEFSNVNSMPLDQYMLASLCASEDRYLFIIGSCISEDWVNAPSMWLCYQAANSIYQFLGLEDHLAVNIHKEGHAVIQEDMEYIIDYFNYHVYGIEPTLDLSALKTSVFDEEANYDPIFDEFNQNWVR